jgi:riboflavin biosynthesis pyrimidine reductase
MSSSNPAADPEIVELFPTTGQPVDPMTAVAAESRPTPNARPWLYTNMITSLDGATAIDGASGDLGGPADQTVFAALRAVADIIVVGSATAIAEDYRPPGASAAAVRIGRGQSPRPALAILSRSLEIDPGRRVFADPDHRPLILTVGRASRHRRDRLAEVADIVEAGADDLDIGLALRLLRQAGHRRALLEGGPTINGRFAAERLIDEWNLSMAPLMVGGSSARAAHGSAPGGGTRFDLRRLWMGDGLLFGRWVRA